MNVAGAELLIQFAGVLACFLTGGLLSVVMVSAVLLGRKD